MSIHLTPPKKSLGLVLGLIASLWLARESSAAEAFSQLSDFGPVKTPAEIQATFDKAVAALNETGGVLCLNPAESEVLRVENTYQGTFRKPAPPAPAKQWGAKPGFTIVEVGSKNTTIAMPAQTGLQINRTLRMGPDDSLGHWTTDFPINIDNRVISGSNSYLDWLAAPVAKGKAARFYVRTIRGIRPGQFLNVHGGPGYGGGVDRVFVQSVGYDADKKLHYFVADTEIDHTADAIAQNKNNVGLLHMDQICNSDEQTYDVMLRRKQYAGGDTYMFFAWYDYMSDIHSAAGDENGNLFAGYVKSLVNNFRAKVDKVDWEKNRLLFTAGQNAETLSNSRPLINLNRKRWITNGKVMIVPPESFWETTDTGKYPFHGKTYPSTVDKAGLHMGGLIRGNKDCPWDQSVVGRYFAVIEPTESVPGAKDLYRWYEITGVTVNADGTKDLTLRRYWWGAKNAASPTLYRLENGTWDGHERPLQYAIAPGTYVNDVAKAVPSPGFKTSPDLGIVPYVDAKTARDFAPGDEIEQAIGPDPFKPTPFRMWVWDSVPGVFPSPILDLANFGSVSRYAAMAVRGGTDNADQLSTRVEQKPAWDNVIAVESAAQVGLNLRADFTDAAILFQQPYREQPIKWYYRPSTNAPRKETTLTVSRDTGQLQFTGSARFAGLSGDAIPARNLRGKNVSVAAGQTSVAVTFPTAEADGDYALFVEQSWISNRAVVKKEAAGFTVQFEKPAPDNAHLDWMLVR